MNRVGDDGLRRDVDDHAVVGERGVQIDERHAGRRLEQPFRCGLWRRRLNRIAEASDRDTGRQCGQRRQRRRPAAVHEHDRCRRSSANRNGSAAAVELKHRREREPSWRSAECWCAPLFLTRRETRGENLRNAASRAAEAGGPKRGLRLQRLEGGGNACSATWLISRARVQSSRSPWLRVRGRALAAGSHDAAADSMRTKSGTIPSRRW